MPTTRKGEALRKLREEDEGDVTITDEESVAERGHEDDAARAGSWPTSQSAPQIPTDFLSTLIKTFTRAQVEANRSLINTLMTSSGDFRASTPVGISSSNATSAGVAVAPASYSDANFTKCTARYDGSSQDTELLEAFLDAVQVYKECAAVSDEHALRGLPMLLEGDAAIWWRGVEASVPSWTTASRHLRRGAACASNPSVDIRQRAGRRTCRNM
ncbi:hypothetical protein HF086_004954 [Spodoptera exigua]|uniref:Uncharacterized protein n=1 Tax=Spodoptera exigua TaxID=7107 RepID=A0A922M2K6_SPOEX|nr:hypothetical protein HF086_004954 [Spodoptera exigua]